MSRIAYVNGRYLPRAQATVAIEDRGFQFADGVYEVCEVRGGRLVDERRHMARLDRSLRAIGMARPMSAAALSVVLHETVRRNFAFPPADTPPSVVVSARSNDRARLEQLAADGIAVITVPDTRWQRVD